MKSAVKNILGDLHLTPQTIVLVTEVIGPEIDYEGETFPGLPIRSSPCSAARFPF